MLTAGFRDFASTNTTIWIIARFTALNISLLIIILNTIQPNEVCHFMTGTPSTSRVVVAGIFDKRLFLLNASKNSDDERSFITGSIEQEKNRHQHRTFPRVNNPPPTHQSFHLHYLYCLHLFGKELAGMRRWTFKKSFFI